MSADCTSEEVAFIPCLYHYDIARSKCLLVYCSECGKDLYRDCEKGILAAV
jgi:hypothetical protein